MMSHPCMIMPSKAPSYTLNTTSSQSYGQERAATRLTANAGSSSRHTTASSQLPRKERAATRFQAGASSSARQNYHLSHETTVSRQLSCQERAATRPLSGTTSSSRTARQSTYVPSSCRDTAVSSGYAPSASYQTRSSIQSLHQEPAATRLLKSSDALITGRPGAASVLEPTTRAAASSIRSYTTSSSGPAQSESSGVAERRERVAAATIAIAASRDRHDARLARIAERKASKFVKPAQREERQPAAFVAAVAPRPARQTKVDLTDPFDERPLKSDPEKIGNCHTANLLFEQRVAALAAKPLQVDKQQDCTATIESISSGKSSSMHSQKRQFEAGLRARQERYEEAKRRKAETEEDGKAEREMLELEKRKKLDDIIRQKQRRFEERTQLHKERMRLKEEEEEAARREVEKREVERREAERRFKERTKLHEERMRLKEEEKETERQETKRKEAERRSREGFVRLQEGKQQMEEREKIFQGREKRIRLERERKVIEIQIQDKKMRLEKRERKFEQDEEEYRLEKNRLEKERRFERRRFAAAIRYENSKRVDGERRSIVRIPGEAAPKVRWTMKFVFNKGKWNEWTRYVFGNPEITQGTTWHWSEERMPEDDPRFDLNNLR